MLRDQAWDSLWQIQVVWWTEAPQQKQKGRVLRAGMLALVSEERNRAVVS